IRVHPRPTSFPFWRTVQGRLTGWGYSSNVAPQLQVGAGPRDEVRLLAATVVIPARYGSTRFPAKILASDTGKPLVQHVVERAKRAARVREVIVATDDERIVDALRAYETKCVMTSPDHQSGTDRIAEVARN